jgi:hypothetical protein
MEKTLRFVEVVLTIVGGTAFLSSWVMNFLLWQSMPVRPNPEEGFALPMIVHGRTVYLSTLYYILYYSMFWGGLALFFCAALIDFYKDPFKRRGRGR